MISLNREVFFDELNGFGRTAVSLVIERQSDALENPGVWGSAPAKRSSAPFFGPDPPNRSNLAV